MAFMFACNCQSLVALITAFILTIGLIPKLGYVNAGEAASFPANFSPFENRCGSVESTNSGTFFHSPSELVQPNERCVWIIAVPRATGYKFQVYQLRDRRHNTEQYGVSVYEFNRYRAPTKVAIGVSGALRFTNSSMLLVTIHTGTDPGEQSGYIFEYTALFDKNAGEMFPVSLNSRHYLINEKLASMKHPQGTFYDENELSSFVFLPPNNFYNPEIPTKINFDFSGVDTGRAQCVSQVIIYFYTAANGTWNENGRYCRNSQEIPIQEVVHNDLVLAVFESDAWVVYSGFKFAYQLSQQRLV